VIAAVASGRGRGDHDRTMAHLFVRITGHGVDLLPAPPYVVRIDGDRLELTGLVGDREEHTMVAAGGDLDPDLGELTEGAFGPWRVEVGGVYSIDWDGELVLVSAPEPDRPPFCMFSDLAGSLVYVQGPMPVARVPAREAMRAEDQQVVDRGEEPGPWIDLAYDHEGVAWRQRHLRRDFGAEHAVVVTTQARAEAAERIHAAADRLAVAVAPYQPRR
jgi:hypothetical protein